MDYSRLWLHPDYAASIAVLVTTYGMNNNRAEDEVVAIGQSKEAYEEHEAGKHEKLR